MLLVRTRYIALVVLIGLYTAGCGYFKLGRDVATMPPPSTSDAEETGGDVPLSDREQTGDMIEPDSDSATTATGSAMPDADPAATTYAPAGARTGGDSAASYRVQVYAFTNRDAAEAARDRVQRYLADWSHRVYLEEEDGSYKIRVGDFIDRADADLLRDRLRGAGYPDAWTVSIR